MTIKNKKLETVDPLQKKIKEHYDKYSSNYDAHNWTASQQSIDGLGFNLIQKYSRGKNVLEVGCGTGNWMIRLKQDVKSIVGVDLSEGMVKEAKKKGLTVFPAGAEKLPFPNHSFETVYSYRVLPHVPEIQKAVAEIKRVLSPGGKALLMFYNKGSLKHFTRRKNMEEKVYTRFYTVPEILALDPELRFVRGVKIFPCPRFVTQYSALHALYMTLEGCASYTPLKRFGGNIFFELEKKSL